MKELPKAYDPAAYEDAIYKKWERSGAFQPRSDHDPKLKDELKPYTVVLPPPNVTGVLHAGHALMITLEDILVRYHRMKGFDTLWVPGTDHAAIATENKVIEKLRAEGKDKESLGRKAFLKEAKQFAAEHKGKIENQTKAIGASLDWTRNTFTMDEVRERSVREAFRRLYEKGLVYRGDYMVNWCPECTTVLADDEVEHKEQEGVLYYLKYGPFELATTRPETKVGDTAVAVNPKDKRYKKYVGQTVDVQMINGVRKLTVIADEAVDPEFGTGVVKVTPFHDKTDYQIGKRHDLEALEVIDEEGRMTEAAGEELAGLDRFAARKKMVEWLKKNDLLIKEELHHNAVGRCYRSDTVIEPRISKQWFLKVSEIAQQAIKFVDDGDLKFVPQRFEKTYRDWLENLHDWCISRQVWFGHPLPVYENAKGEVSLEPKSGFKASEDTLDTWFSSALWPFSTLGWPNETDDFKRFFPNDVLETGYEIIFFWVARMVLMTIALDVRGEAGTAKPPFHTVYLNGIVRDKRGRKFSKSLGNGVDPLELIGRYGTDAVRFTLATSNAPGADIKFDEKRIVGNRNFANKLWNIARFVLSQEDAPADLEQLDPKQLTTIDRAILHRLRETAEAVEAALHDDAVYGKSQPKPEAGPPPRHPRPYDLAAAGNALYSFIWSDFADWYLEAAKVQLKHDGQRRNTAIILRYVLDTTLKLLHPYMPFITEVIWQDGFGHREQLMVQAWPSLHENLDQPDDAATFAEFREVVETIRRARAERGTPAAAWIDVTLVAPEPDFFDEAAPVLKQLARAKSLSIGSDLKLPKGSVKAIAGRVTLGLTGLEDESAEQDRLRKELAETKIKVERLEKRLQNKDYASKAPQHVVAQTKAELETARQAVKKLESGR